MKRVDLAIGLTTGRRSFKKVLSAYLNTWDESRKWMQKDIDVHLSLFVSYDLNYQNTQSTDYTNLKQDVVDVFDSILFIGAKNASRYLEKLQKGNTFSKDEIKSIFGSGYAGKRNAILFSAIEYRMDYLLFIDDDEYPVAVTHNKNTCLWSGQQLFLTHLQEIDQADYTNGYHCGYISPIPQISYNNKLREKDFRKFIDAISNDIINWDSIRSLIDTGGVTYASTEILTNQKVQEVPWENGCRFVSGANLCINLKDPQRTLPFYNPPGARGEDTFLSTMLRDYTVKKVPCYAFHDGFSFYQHLLDGSLPIHLANISIDSSSVITRFFKACIGWVRYKPLFIYITCPNEFSQKIKSINEALDQTVPLLADYFQDTRFLLIPKEFEKYASNVEKHYKGYILALETWPKIIRQID